jgi:hypothetical protein
MMVKLARQGGLLGWGAIVCGVLLLPQSTSVASYSPGKLAETTIAQASSATNTPFKEPRIALVIGNSAYANGALRNPVNDANEIEKVLKRLGFTVIISKDSSRQKMNEAIEKFAVQLKASKGGIGLFFYAGHGVQVNGESYLMPVGAKVNQQSDVPNEAISLSRLIGNMKDDSGSRKSILLLDACRNNPFKIGAGESIPVGLAYPSAVPQDTFISFATSPSQVAGDGSGKNSPYTVGLIENLEAKNTPLTSVFPLVRQSVRENTSGAQITWDSSSLTESVFLNQVSISPQGLPKGFIWENNGILGNQYSVNPDKDIFTVTAAPKTNSNNEARILTTVGDGFAVRIRVTFRSNLPSQRATFGVRSIPDDVSKMRRAGTADGFLRISIAGGNSKMGGRTIETVYHEDSSKKPELFREEYDKIPYYNDAWVSPNYSTVYFTISFARGGISAHYFSPGGSGKMTVSRFVRNGYGRKLEMFMGVSSSDPNRKASAEFSEFSLIRDGR